MSRPLLILDLDETLVHATDAPLEFAAAFRCGPYYVYERPFVREFCASAAEHYELAVWTSASADYAQCVVDRIMGVSALGFLWTRDRCTRRLDPDMREHYWVKDLKKVRRVGYDLRRVLVVEDTIRKLERQYGNVVLVREFTGDPQDRELVFLAKYVLGIAARQDFRVIDKRGWRSELAT